MLVNMEGLACKALTFKRSVFAYANYESAWKNMPLEFDFMYLGNKEIYCIFKTCSIISIIFSTKCHLFRNFIIFSSNNVFKNRVLKFKYYPSHLKVNTISLYLPA
jgi:hypothetical protein